MRIPLTKIELNFGGRSSSPIRLANDPNNKGQAGGKERLMPDGTRIKGGRSSIDDNVTLFGILMDELAQISPDFPIECIKIIRHLAKYNADLSYAVSNIQHLGNTKLTFKFDADVPKELQKKMQQELKAASKRWYKGGITSLGNDLFAQIAITGALSGEACAELDLSSIKKVVLVPTDEIVFMYDKPTDEYKPHQKANTVLIAAPNVLNLIPLNPTTYKYHAITKHDNSPYAIPPFMSALESIEIEKEMLANIRLVIRRLGVMGFLSVLVNGPKPKQNEADKDYLKRCEDYLNQIMPEIQKGFNSGLAVGFKDTHEFEMVHTGKDLRGVKDILEVLTQFKMAGLKQDPLMLGRNFNIAETMAKVILAKLSTLVRNYQSVVENFIGEVATLHLQLCGYAVTCVEAEYAEPMIGDALAAEQTNTAKIANLKALFQQNIIDNQEFAEQTGYEKPIEDEPRALPNMTGDGTTPPAGGGGGGIPPKPKDKKPPEQKTKVTLTRSLVSRLVKEPLTGTGTREIMLVLSDGTEIEALVDEQTLEATVNGSIELADVVDMEVMSWQLEAERLGMLYPEFDYGVGCECGDTTHVHSFGKENKRLQDFIKEYGDAASAVYAASTRKVINKVGAALADMSKGSTLEQVQNRVQYIIYKDWKTTFSKGQKTVVNKWVEVMYKEMRQDTAPFINAAAIKVPEATFGLRDFRTMNYYKKSDDFYLGKFVTDDDTRKRLSEFIKKTYIEEGLPLKGNAGVMEDFKAKFGDMFAGEEWKLQRIIETTVGKLRNYASVAYINQAGVESFMIVGINDRKQCAYCSTMQGKTFSVVTALDKIDRVTKSEPEFIKEESPFITSVFKGKEGLEKLQGMSADDIQSAGIDTPPYHGSCRDRVVAVL